MTPKTLVIAAGLILGAAAFQVRAQVAAEPTDAKVKAEVKARFAALDLNKDGLLDLAEFTEGQEKPKKAEKAFAKRDKNGDGTLSMAEFAHASILAKVKSKIGGSDNPERDGGLAEPDSTHRDEFGEKGVDY